ncbi:hypothetical protein [Plantactinospora sp. B5E13]
MIRTRRLIRQSDPEALHISLPTHGRLHLEWDNSSTSCDTNDLLVLDTG